MQGLAATSGRGSSWLKRAISLAAMVLSVACGGDEKPTPPPGSPLTESTVPNPAVIIAVGDIAVCGSNADESTAAIADSLLQADSAENLQTLVLTLGDNAYPSGDDGMSRVFTRCFLPSWGKPRIMNVIRPSPGNHDYEGGSGSPYFRYFGARAGEPDKGYYSFDFAGWHFVSLNSEVVGGENFVEKEQESWLQADLRAHAAECTVAYWHRPRFSSGPHGSNRAFQRLWQILYQNGVDLVLNGHDHDYERFIAQTPDGRPDPRRGIVEFVAGTGGGSLTGARDRLAPNSASHVNGQFGILKLMIGDGEYAHAFLDTKGRVWDPGTGKCH
ncbi:MAG TPA: metallophosphoesterase [Gemmatimonadaceae bacterium]|nr:metallophosphoesterase [Gemmatimonadaceae bacterium]